MPRPIRLRSLRTRIIAWSFVPATLILFAVALVAYDAYQQVTRDLVVERNQELARLSASQLAGEMDEYSARLAAWAHSSASHARNDEALQAVLQQASNQLAVFDGGVVVLDGKGIVQVASPERTEVVGQDWSSRHYFRQAAYIGRPVFSDVVADGPGGTPAIAVVAPIFGAEGELRGVAAGMFRLGATTLSSLYGSIVKLHIGGEDTIYLVDSKGQVLYHADISRIGQDFSGQSAVQQVQAGDTGAFRAQDWAGREIVASFAPVPGTPWGLVIESDWHALLRSRQTYRNLLLGLLVLGVIVPAIVVAVGVRRITQPIADLIGAAQQVAQGNFGQTVSASTGDEIEELVEQFNLMSTQLEGSYSALQQSEERFSLAMQGANDGLWDWNVRTGHVYYSPRWCKMLGYEEDEIEPTLQGWESLIHPDDLGPAMEGVNGFLSGQLDKFEIEFRMLHKEGHYVDVLSRAFGVREASGRRVVRLVGTHIDITYRKRAEEEIRRQNEYLAALHETTLGVVSRLELADLLETVVERAVSLVGASFGFVYLVTPEKDEMEVEVATGWFHDYVGARLKRGEALSGQVWAEGRPMAVEDFEAWSGYAHSEGEVGPAMGVPLKSGPEVTGVIGVARAAGASPFQQGEIDLISRFANLASIALDNARLHASLEQRVQERTHELATLNAVAAVVSRSLDLEAILGDALDQTLATLRMETGVAYRLEGEPDDPEDRLTLHPLAHRGLSEEFIRLASPIPVRGTKLEAAAASGKPLVWTPDDPTLEPQIGAGLAKEGLRQVVSIPLVAKGEWVGAMYIGTSRERTLAQEQLSLLAAVGQQVGMAVENARLYEAEQERREESERRRQVAEGMREVLAVLNSQQVLDETLNFIARQACRLMGCDATSIEQLEREDGSLRFQSTCGLDGTILSRGTLPFERTITAQALRERRPIVLLDSVEMGSVVRDHDRRPGSQYPVLMPHLQQFLSLLTVPLVVRDQDYGGLTFYYRERRTLSEEEVQLAQSIADQAALAIESARLRQQAEQAAALAERSRLSRELHDSVTQSVYSVMMYAEAATRLLSTGQEPQALEYLRDARDTAQEALREMRLLIFELRPLVLETNGLAGALQARLDAVEKRGGVQAELRVEGVEAMASDNWMPIGEQQELYHIAQEALNNSLKHAKASHLQVELQVEDSAVRLEIADNGCGFDPSTASSRGGLGLPGMRERAQRLGGQLKIESAPGQGTSVQVVVLRNGNPWLGATGES